MSKLNKKKPIVKTAEGGKAFRLHDGEAQLRRCVMSCLLWEREFYVEGEDIAKQIGLYARNVTPEILADVAIEARNYYHLRHVPLLLLSILCETGSGSSIVSDTFPKVINRVDELTEFVAVYAKVNGVSPSAVKKKLSAQAKKGLAKAFRKFDEHQLAKYNRDGEIKLRDVLFLCHAKPKNRDQDLMWKRLITGKLATPDTWETELSAGKDKKETFTRLIKEEKLGYLALLRNLRNMVDSGVDTKLIKQALEKGGNGKDKVLPFRFVAAARQAPSLEKYIDEAMQESINNLPELKGKTAIVVDVSGSMNTRLSAKSELTRFDAAAALASIVKAEELRVFAFSTDVKEVPARRGMAGIDSLRAVFGGSTKLRKALVEIADKYKYARIIVISDEQSEDGICDPIKGAKGYMINVASNKNGVGYGVWTHFDGFSENIIKFIYELENVRE